MSAVLANIWPSGRFVHFAIWAALVIACAAALGLWQVDTRYAFDLSPNDLAYDEGAAFRVPIAGQMPWPWQGASDTNSDPRQSRLILFEDGRPLGPPHQAHAEIRFLGNGRYSHWDNYILFSTSDNSDPRTNGRHYYAIDYATLSPLVGVLPWLLLFAWAMASAREVWIYAQRWWLIRRLSSAYRALERRIGELGIFLTSAAPVVVFANMIVIRHWPLPAALTSDTALYVGFNELRTIGYPAFLKTVIVLCGDLRLLVVIQLNLLLGSIVILGWTIARIVGSLVWGIALLLVLALNPALMAWAEQIMTEGLFIPLLLVHAALVLLLLRRPSYATAAFAGVTLVAAILVRPAAYSLLVNLPLLILLLRPRQPAILAWTIIPAAALYLAAAGAHKAALGTWQSQSFGGYTLLGKVALLIHGNVPGAPPVGEEIYRRIAAEVLDAETKRFPTEFWVYTANVYDAVLYGKVAPVLLDYVRRNGTNSSDNYSAVWRQMNSVAWTLAVRVIEQDPIGYLKLVLSQFYGLWSITLTASVPIGENYVEKMDQSLKLLDENPGLRSWAQQVGLSEDTFLIARAAYLKNSASYHPFDEFFQKAIPAFRLVLVGVVVWVVFVLCPYWIWRLLSGRPVLGPSAALLYLGITLSSYYLLVASVEFALPRYVEAFEGITISIDIIALSVLTAYFWIILPTILSALRGLCFRKQSAEMGSENISAAEAGAVRGRWRRTDAETCRRGNRSRPICLARRQYDLRSSCFLSGTRGVLSEFARHHFAGLAPASRGGPPDNRALDNSSEKN
jgi:hypothetical protein